MCLYVTIVSGLKSHGWMMKYIIFLIASRQAWQKLGAMPPEEAMQKYIDIVTELYPTWAAGLSAVRINLFFFYHVSVSLKLPQIFYFIKDILRLLNPSFFNYG